jgi:hypothetical protein
MLDIGIPGNGAQQRKLTDASSPSPRRTTEQNATNRKRGIAMRHRQEGLADGLRGVWQGPMSLSEAETAVREMKENKKLEVLLLLGVSVSEDTGAVLGAALRSVKKLRMVSISHCDGPGLVAFFDGVPDWVTTLTFDHCPRLDEAARASIVRAMGRCRGLKKVYVSPLHLGSTMTEAIVAAPLEELYIRELDAREGAVRPEHVRAAGEVVRRAASLSSLVVSFLFVPDGFEEELVRMMEANRSVRSLRFMSVTEGPTCWPRILDLNRLKDLYISRAMRVEETLQALGRNKSLISFRYPSDCPGALLLEAVEHNGMLLNVDVRLADTRHADTLKQLLDRNRAMHERTRRAALLLLTIRKFAKSELSRHPRDIVLIISKMVWSTRADFAWNYNSANTVTEQVKKRAK